MISTISRSEVVGRVSDLTRSTHLATVHHVYHHYYTSSSHSGSFPAPVTIGIIAVVVVILVVRKVMGSN